MSKITERRDAQREALIEAAERRIDREGPAGLKARELAAEIGVALGAIYNLVTDMDELVLRVISRTLARLDAALSEGEAPLESREAARARLIAIACRYRDFAAENLHLWRIMFEHRLAADRALPEWAVADQMRLFRHILGPLAILMPTLDAAEREERAKTLFGAVHGIVALGLDQKLVAVPLAAIDAQLEWLLSAVCDGDEE